MNNGRTLLGPSVHQVPAAREPDPRRAIRRGRPSDVPIVFERSMSRSLAGIDNELSYRDSTRMLFSDAKKARTSLVQELDPAVAL